VIKRFGEPPHFGRKYTLRPGAYAVLVRDGQVLLTYQSEPHHEYQLPGGGIDKEEHPVSALHREVYEETGWRISTPKRLGAFRRFTYMPEYDLWAEKMCTIFLARPVMRMGPPLEPDHAAVFTDPAFAVAHVGNEGDRAFLRSVMGL